MAYYLKYDKIWNSSLFQDLRAANLIQDSIKYIVKDFPQSRFYFTLIGSQPETTMTLDCHYGSAFFRTVYSNKVEEFDGPPIEDLLKCWRIKEAQDILLLNLNFFSKDYLDQCTYEDLE